MWKIMYPTPKLEVSPLKVKRPAFPLKVADELKRFRNSEILCDVKLVVDGREYPAHKIILAALSPYFKTMFTSMYAESHQSTIELQTIKFCAIEAILNYGYGKKFEITADNVLAVVHAAHLLQVSHVETKAFDFLIKNIDVGNCVGIFQMAKMYSKDDCKKTAKDFLLKHFCQVTQDDEFFGLNADELIEIISDENLFVDNEEEVFVAVIAWIISREEQRVPFLDQVLSHVRLDYVNSNLLKERLQTVKALQNSKLFLDFVTRSQPIEAMPLQAVSKPRPSWPTEVLVVYVTPWKASGMRRVCISKSGAVVKESLISDVERRFTNSYVVLHGETTVAVVGDQRSLQKYDKKTSSWTGVPIDRFVKRGCGYTCIGNDWYVIGGFCAHSTSVTTTEVFRWNSVTMEKTMLAPMHTPVEGAAVVTLGGKIYVFGGFRCGVGDQSDFEKYSNKRPLGQTPKTTSDSVQIYDVATDRWTGFPLPGAQFREVVGACVLLDRIFVIRRNYPFFPKAKRLKAQQSQQQVFCYNPMGHWIKCGDLNHPFHSGPVVYKGKIYVLTNKSIDATANVKSHRHYSYRQERFLERYSPETNSWKVFGDFPDATAEAVFGPLPVRCLREQGDKNDVKLRLL